MTEPGQPNAAILELAFWEAAKRLFADDAVHDMNKPYFDQEMDMVDTSGCGMPSMFWVHMADALADLRVAAGVEGKPR